MDAPTHKLNFELGFELSREPALTSGDPRRRLRSALWVSIVVHSLLVLGFVVFWPVPPPAFKAPQFQITLHQSTPKKPIETEAVLADPSDTEDPVDDSPAPPDITTAPTTAEIQPRELEARTQPLDLSLPPLETPLGTLPSNEHSAIFHPQLNARFHQAVARKRGQSGASKSPETYFNRFGEEIIAFNGGCAKIQSARDRHDVDTVYLSTPCPGHKDEGTRMMERLNENLRKRYGSKSEN